MRKRYKKNQEAEAAAVEKHINTLMALDKNGKPFAYPRQNVRLDGQPCAPGEGITTCYVARWLDTNTNEWVVDIDDEVQRRVNKSDTSKHMKAEDKAALLTAIATAEPA